MSELSINSTELTSPLMNLLNAQNIEPGTDVGYGLCKALWEYHPLGGKLVEKPVRLALSKPRIITVDAEPKEMLVEAFEREWEDLGATAHIRDTMFLKRCYGASAIVYGAPNIPTTEPISPWDLPDLHLYFNQLDPLNLAGSIVTNQNPNAPDFQKPLAYTTAAGQPYHPSRSVVVFNGTPIYLSFQSSAFGFTGRSVFQRALYPMKSFIQSMRTDDMVTYKAGLLISKQKPAGSIVNRLMQQAASIKRQYLQEGGTGNVLSIDIDEEINSIDMTNTHTAMTTARDNIIANIAAASDVPALLLKDEAFTQGFGEGTEDAKAIVQYVEGIREEMRSLYKFFDNIVMHRAWNRQFFEAVQRAYPDIYGNKTYEQTFYHWKRNFHAEWEELMQEPPSEQVKVDEIKLKGVTEFLRTILPIVDPQNRGIAIQWAQDNVNEMQNMFQSSMQLDIDAIAEYEPPANAMPEEKMPKADSLIGSNPVYIDNFFNRSDADFKESEHPRDKSGKFAKGSGGGSAAAEFESPAPAKEQTLTLTNKGGKEIVVTKAAYENNKESYNSKGFEAPASAQENKPEGKGRGFEKGGKDKHGFERSPGLDKKERRIEGTFYNAIRNNKDQLVSDYWKRMADDDFPNTVDPDKVKLASPAFRKNRNLPVAVHEPSLYLSKVIYTQALEKKRQAGDTSPTIFTAGGSGSGKSATTPLAAGRLGVGKDALVFDSVMGSKKSATKKIDEALQLTKGDAAIVYTNTPIERALKFNAGRDRSVSIDTLVDAHVGASQTIRELQEHYKDNKRVKIQVINNFGPPQNVHEGKVEDVPTYDKAALKKQLQGVVKEMYSKGEISKEKFAVLMGKGVL